MQEETINLTNLKFALVLKYVFVYLKWMTISVCVFFLLILILVPEMYVEILSYLLIYIFGVIVSIGIHEYAHIFVIRKLTDLSKVKIRITGNKFEIVSLLPIKGRISIIVAFAGPFSCVGVAIVLYCINNIILPSGFILSSLSICYGLHIINFLPFFGDGLMILKEILELLKRR